MRTARFRLTFRRFVQRDGERMYSYATEVVEALGWLHAVDIALSRRDDEDEELASIARIDL